MTQESLGAIDEDDCSIMYDNIGSQDVFQAFAADEAPVSLVAKPYELFKPLFNELKGLFGGLDHLHRLLTT